MTIRTTSDSRSDSPAASVGRSRRDRITVWFRGLSTNLLNVVSVAILGAPSQIVRQRPQMNDEQVGKLFEALIGEIKGLREDIKKQQLAWDPEKLKSSTSDPAKLPGLKVVERTSVLEEPWPPGTERPRPEPVRPPR